MKAQGSVQASALVVDDHPVNRELFAQQLAVLGFEVECAVDGEDGWRRWHARRHPVALIDRAMPGIDGPALARRIRELEGAPGGQAARSVLLGCTANVGSDMESSWAPARMDAVLAKPCDIGMLEAVLRRCGALSTVRCTAHLGQVGAAPAVPVDMDFVARSYGHAPGTAPAMLKEFVAVTETDAQALREAVVRRDAPAVEHNAHRILGASRMIAARELARLAAHLEAVARAGEWRRIEAGIAACEHEFARIASFAASFGRKLR